MGALALARRHLRGQGARAALTAAGVACGVALVVAIRVINASTLASFTDAIEDLAGTAAPTLPLRTPHGIETFTVRGVLPPGGVGRAFGGNLILMDVVGAQLVLGEDGLIDQVDVTLEPGVRVEDVERRLRAALPAGLEAIRPARRGEQIERYLASFQTLLSGLSGLALLAAIFVVGSAVATSVAARRREP